MYALFEYKGKQYKAEKGAVIRVDSIDAEKGSAITIDTVLFVNNDGKVSIGAPYVKGASVKAVVDSSFRDKKVLVLKYKAKKDYRRLIGHRQHYTNIVIQDVVTA
ncbi:MAG: 50S ribosomal protein L21 [Treponemataceae bacterium]|nr:MAG: 50S ribosomal protein L21 [Treponemataceae bacterium]